MLRAKWAPAADNRQPRASSLIAQHFRYTGRDMIRLGSHPLWHPLFEALAYVTGFAVFFRSRRHRGDSLDQTQRWTVIATACLGAVMGGRVLGLAEQWPTLFAASRSGHLATLLLSPGGKTIVGALLGGWLAVELVKRFSGIHSQTGNLLALPLCVGIAVGRIGCLIAGLADDTYGKPTRLPWGVDLGDGIPRHPVQLYEILFLGLLAFLLTRRQRWPEGSEFRCFLAAYLGWRLLIDFLKPQPVIAGMSIIQWSCAGGLAVLAILFMQGRRGSRRKAAAHAAMA